MLVVFGKRKVECLWSLKENPITSMKTNIKKKQNIQITTSQKLKRLRNKADRLFQMVGRMNYDKCLVCGGEYSCLHHYYPKSTSTPLRYDFHNTIPLCVKCHFSHHNGNPEIHNKVNMIMGLEWVEELEWRKHNLKIKPDQQWYKTQIEIMETMLSVK